MSGVITSTERLQRLLALVPYVVSRKVVTLAETAAAFGISERELVDDLNLLWCVELRAPDPYCPIDLSYEGGEIVVSQAESMGRPLRLAVDEASALLVALRMLAELPGLEDRSAMSRLIAKLEEAAGEAASASAQVAVQVDVHGDGTDGLAAQVRAAIAAGRRLHLRYYVPGRDEATERDVDPMRLLVVDGRPYLEGWCLRAEGMRLFRLDRVLELAVLDQPASPPPEAEPVDVDQGLFRPSPDDVQVELELSPEGRWVAEHYPCESVSELPEGRLRVVLRTPDTGWVRRLALRLGEDGRVISPPGLVTEVRDTAAAALANYVVLAAATPPLTPPKPVPAAAPCRLRPRKVVSGAKEDLMNFGDLFDSPWKILDRCCSDHRAVRVEEAAARGSFAGPVHAHPEEGSARPARGRDGACRPGPGRRLCAGRAHRRSRPPRRPCRRRTSRPRSTRCSSRSATCSGPPRWTPSRLTPRELSSPARPRAPIAASGRGHGETVRRHPGRSHCRRAVRAHPAAAEPRGADAADGPYPGAAQPGGQDVAGPGRGHDCRVHLLQPGLAHHRAPVVPRGDTRADRVQYARRQPAGLVGANGRVLPAGKGRRHRRGDPLLADLAVPDLGLHCARPVHPGEALGLHLHRYRRPVVPDRGRARLPVAGPVHALPARPDSDRMWRTSSASTST